jgi:hypothetical protein
MAKGGETKDYSGNYYSTNDFVGVNNLEKEADSLFGKDWEAEDDANQILELTNYLGGGYKVIVADDRDDWQNLRYKHDVNHTTSDSNYDIFVFHERKKRKMADGGKMANYGGMMAKGGEVVYGSLYKKIVEAVERKLKISNDEATNLVDENEAFIIDMIEYEEIKSPNQIADAIISDYGEDEYKKGGMSQGYDDREDERLAMKYGKIKSKYLNSTKARRDDARFEERMEDGGYMADGGKVAKEYKLVPMIPYGVKGMITTDYKSTQRFMGTEDEAVAKAKELANSNPNFVRVEIKRELKTKTNTVGIVDGQNKNYSDGGIMAKGGELKEGDYVWNALGKKLIVNKVTDEEYYLYSFGQPSDSPISKKKVDGYIKSGEWSLKPKMEDGRMMAKGGRPLSAINRDRAYKSDELWEQNYKRKTRPKNPKYSK